MERLYWAGRLAIVLFLFAAVSRGWFDSFIDTEGKNRSQYQCKIDGVNMRVFRCKLKVGVDDGSEDDFLK